MKFSRLFLGLFIASIFIFPQTSLGQTSSLADLKAKIEKAETELASAEKDLNSTPTASTTIRSSLQGVIVSLKSDIAKLNEDLKKAQDQKSADTVTGAVTDIEKAREELKNCDTIPEVGAYNQCKAEAQKKISAASGKIQNVQQNIDGGTACGFPKVFTNLGTCLLQTVGSIFDNAVNFLFGGVILYTAGMLLDYSIYFSVVKFADIIGSSDAGAVQTSVYSIWIFIRNLFNIIIVFELLYLSITMIWKGYDESAFKSRLIAALVFAIGINFSFYFTKVLIDFSNITTLQIYSAINPQGDIGSISGHFMEKMNTARDFDNFSKGGGASGQAVASLVEPFIKAIFLLIMTGVFASLSLVFIKRGVVLIFILILSPLMFAKFAGVGVIRSVSGWSEKWWKALTDELFMAPLTMLMIYLVLRIMSSGMLGQDMFNGLTGSASVIPMGGNSAQQAGALTGGAIIGVLVKYFVLAALAAAALKIARSFSQGSSKAVQDKIDKAGGFVFGGALGAGAWALRRTVGKGAADRMSGEWADTQRNRAAQGGLGGLVARTQLKTVEGLSKSSLDIRNTDFVKDGSKKMGISSLLGNAKDGGFVKDIEDDEKKKKAIAEAKLKYTQKDISKIDTSTKEGKIKKLEAEAANAARAQEFRLNEAYYSGAEISDEMKAVLMKNIEEKQAIIARKEAAKESASEEEVRGLEAEIKKYQDSISEDEKKLQGKGLGARALTNTVNMTLPSSISGAKNYGSLVSKDFTKNTTRTIGKEEDFTDEKIKGSIDKANEALEKAKKGFEEKKIIEKNQKAADRMALALLAGKSDWHMSTHDEGATKALEKEVQGFGLENDKKSAEKIIEKHVQSLKGSLRTPIRETAEDGTTIERPKTPEEKDKIRKEIGIANLAKKRLEATEKKFTEGVEEKKDEKKDGEKDDKKDDKK